MRHNFTRTVAILAVSTVLLSAMASYWGSAVGQGTGGGTGGGKGDGTGGGNGTGGGKGNGTAAQGEAPHLPRLEREFGAVGDGQADDTAALQQAVDKGDGRLRLPPGTYRITRTIEIDLDRVGPFSIVGDGVARVVMEGTGPAFRLVGTHAGTADPGTVKPNVWARQRMPLVDGLEIVGAHAEADGIEAAGTMQLTVTRVTVRDARHGLRLTGRNRNVVISECHFYHNRGVGIFLDDLNLHQVNITNSHVSYNAAGGIVVRNSEVRNLHIGSCDIEGNLDNDGPPTANVLLDASTRSIREVAIVGCTIQHTSNAPGSANIRLVGAGPDNNLKVGNCTIADNVLSDVGVNIHLQHARGVIISGNTLWRGLNHNILVENSTQIVLGENLLDRSPDYRDSESANGVELINSTDCSIGQLHIQGAQAPAGAILLRDCQWCRVRGATVLESDGPGVTLDNCEHTSITDCLVRDLRPHTGPLVSIRVAGGSENTIDRNEVNGKIER